MWFAKSAAEALTLLGVNPATGLSGQEVESLLQKKGLNRLKDKPKKSLFSLFLAQFQDMLIYVLLGAAAVTLFIGEYIDSVIILFVVVLNATLGVAQEYKAGKALEALHKMTTPKALARRDGKVIEINAELLVPGDIIVIDSGRYIPADLRLIETVNLQIEESALTGESVPSVKTASALFADPKTPIGDRTNMAFMSTLATYGRGEGVVVATAMDTEIGKIAKSLDDDHEELTPLQIRLAELGKILGFIAIGICLLIFLISAIQKRDLLEMFLTSISLAVAAIPEGLAAIVAIVLALGVTRMSRKNAIVKKLTSVETLGSVNIICSDKTGTLTQNKMTVVKTYTPDQTKVVPAEGNVLKSSVVETQLIKSFVLCSDATYDNGQGVGDPTEIALVIWADRFGLSKKELNSQSARIGEKPFDSDRKLMSTLNQEGSAYRVHTKGAIDQLLKVSSHALVDGKSVLLTDELKSRFLQVTEDMSNEALRVLGVAFKDTHQIIGIEDMEQNLTVVGLVGMIDPPRLEVRDSIKEARNAGITSIMITGDHKNTAVAIAKELGIADSITHSLTGAEIDALSDEEFARDICNYRVFARVSPEHKVKIIKAYKVQGHIVAMTGDGINDAPSLQYADIGIAMGITGTDVAKGASDMILIDDNFTTIVHAVEEGRNIYNNIKKAVIFLLSCNLGEVIAVFFSILFYWPVALLPTQILWINLITDSLPAIALGVDPGDKDVMKRKPRNIKESFFAKGAGVTILIGGSLIGALTLAAFYLGLSEFGYSLGSSDIPPDVLTNARTMAFVVLAVSQLFYSLSMRSATKSVFQLGLFSNQYLAGAIAIGIALQVMVISIPLLAKAFQVQNLSFADWGMVLVLSLIPLIVNEIIKVANRKP